MNYRELMSDIMSQLKQKGANSVQIWFCLSNTDEINVNYKEVNLLRTMTNNTMQIEIIKDQKQATVTLNQFDPTSIATSIERLFTAMESSPPDPAWEIAPNQGVHVWNKGVLESGLDHITDRLREFTENVKQRYPMVQFDSTATYQKRHALYLNSNGSDFEQNRGQYSFMVMFNSKIGKKISSFNYTGFETLDLHSDLLTQNMTEMLIEQNTQQTELKPIPENFTGDVILMPFVGGELLGTLLSEHFGSGGLLRKTSRFPDHIEQKILDEKLTVGDLPLDEKLIASNYCDDGFLAKNATIIDKGVLKHYLITLYTANKTGKKRTIGPGETMVVEPGKTPYLDMIAGIKEGVLCMRGSHGEPNANGDFSSVLKNSYYIKDGKLAYPINETMMNANIIDMFNNIKDISVETINTGDSIVPFFQIGDIYFSRK